jgi:hypothetical protein
MAGLRREIPCLVQPYCNVKDTDSRKTAQILQTIPCALQIICLKYSNMFIVYMLYTVYKERVVYSFVVSCEESVMFFARNYIGITRSQYFVV